METDRGRHATTIEPVVVRGSSMSPTFEEGDVLLIDRSRRRPRYGDVVAFTRGHGVIVHRSIGFRREMGDALPRPRPLPPAEVVGVAVVHTRGTRCLLYTSPSPRDGLLSRMPSSA